MTEPYDHETAPVGNTAADQARNAALLGEYDYDQYPAGITGYTGQDLQRVARLSWQPAVRVRVGGRGNYKAGLTQMADGRLVMVVYHGNQTTDPAERKRKPCFGYVYESTDGGLCWTHTGEVGFSGKEPTLTALSDGGLLLTTEGPSGGTQLDESITSTSCDGGRSWESYVLPGYECPRSLVVEPEGSVLMVRALKSGWIHRGAGSPHFQLCRSRDGGRTWSYSVGEVDWDDTEFGEISVVQLDDGRLLAAVRRQVPGTKGEGFEDTVLTESADGGRHWAAPWQISANAEVHFYLTQLRDGRLLGTYSSYHLPFGVFAVVSEDSGRTWDLGHPVQLALSADVYVGWPVTVLLADGALLTSYAATAYSHQAPGNTTCEVVRWSLH
ncbi:MAG: sialidase family protein [Candidatus Latescibacterota bacterium]